MDYTLNDQAIKRKKLSPEDPDYCLPQSWFAPDIFHLFLPEDLVRYKV